MFYLLDPFIYNPNSGFVLTITSSCTISEGAVIYKVWFSDIHKDVVAFRKQWQEKYSSGNSEDVNINLCQYSDIFSTSNGNPLFEQINRRNRMFRANFVVKLLLLCQGKQDEEYTFPYIEEVIYIA